MAKMSFEEYLEARAAYADYLKTEEGKKDEKDPVKPKGEKDPKPEDDQKKEETPADPEPEKNYGDDVQKQLDEIKAAMGVMAKALQPSLGDIKPVGIDDVVKKFFDVE